MKKKIMLVGFLAAILLTLPFTAIANGPADLDNKDDERQEKEPEISSASSAFNVHGEYFSDELTADNQFSVEYLQTILNEMEPMLGDDPVYQEVQAQLIDVSDEMVTQGGGGCKLLFWLMAHACVGGSNPLCSLFCGLYDLFCWAASSTTTNGCDCVAEQTQIEDLYDIFYVNEVTTLTD